MKDVRDKTLAAFQREEIKNLENRNRELESQINVLFVFNGLWVIVSLIFIVAFMFFR